MSHLPDVPDTKPDRPRSVGDDPREATGAAFDPAHKTWFRDLDEAVVEADRCIQCGTCVAACPSDSIGIDEATNRPTLVRMCTGCSRCWDFCPRSGLRYERLIDEFGAEPRATYTARAATPEFREQGQDGGAVTALLAGLFKTGEIDGALVATERDEEPLRGETALVTSVEELRACGGSFYNQTMHLGRLEELVGEADLQDPRLALVGTPCVIEGATALMEHQWEDELDEIVLTISLVCTRSFAYDRLRSMLVERGINLGAVDCLDISDGELNVVDTEGTTIYSESVEAFDAAALRGCAECSDALGETADLTAGNVGTGEGETTLLVRSKRGEAALEAAVGTVDLELIDENGMIDELEEFAAWNRRVAEEVIPRPLDDDGPLTITYEDHRDAYADTDREPEPFNRARVHQYEEWC